MSNGGVLAQMRVAMLATLVVSACGGSSTTTTQSAKLDVPPPREQAPQEPTGAPKRGAPGQSERARLEASCLAQPWTSGRPELVPKPLSVAEQERLDALMAPEPNGCRDVHPQLPPGRFAAGYPIPVAECHYGIARIFFESRRWADAARWFGKVTFEHAQADVGIFAGQLYLESLNVLGSHGSPKRMDCYELMAEDAERIACAYCKAAENREQCSVLQRVRFDVKRLLATGAIPPGADAGNCASGQRSVAGRCEPLPPLVPADCTQFANRDR